MNDGWLKGAGKDCPTVLPQPVCVSYKWPSTYQKEGVRAPIEDVIVEIRHGIAGQEIVDGGFIGAGVEAALDK